MNYVMGLNFLLQIQYDKNLCIRSGQSGLELLEKHIVNVLLY